MKRIPTASAVLLVESIVKFLPTSSLAISGAAGPRAGQVSDVPPGRQPDFTDQAPLSVLSRGAQAATQPRVDGARSREAGRPERSSGYRFTSAARFRSR